MIAALSNFGDIVPQSMRRGKIRDTNILTGTRYVQINDVVNTIPTEIEVGEFQIRVFCNNGKTECKHCGDTYVTTADNPGTYRKNATQKKR